MNQSIVYGNGSEEEAEKARRILYHQTVDFEFAMLAKYYPFAYYTDLIFPFVVYAVGFIGNSVSAVLWFQRRLSRNNSSAFYMALTVIDHLLYLVLHCVDHMNKLFHWQLPGRCYLYCEVLMYLMHFARYLSPLLVLGFVGERFVAVCYPLHRRIVCRTRTARTYAAVGASVVGALCIAHPVFWTVDPAKGYCSYRDFPGVTATWQVFSLLTEVFFLAVVPLVIVALDLSVVVALCRIRRAAMRMKRNRLSMALQKLPSESHKGAGGGGGGGPGLEDCDGDAKMEEEMEDRSMPELAIRVPAQVTTAFILTVSMYEAICLMSESTVYLLMSSYLRGDPSMTEAEIVQDPTWIGFLRYSAAQCIVYNLALTRHGCLILLFLAMGPRFRDALCDLIRCRKSRPPTPEVTRNTWMSSSTGSRSRICVPASH